jgi:hypothetical protein
MSIEIKIEEPLKGSLTKEIFFGQKGRIPSHTDVAFISRSRLVIAHRFSGKLFLVDVKGGSFQMVCSYKLWYNGKYEFPDLIHAYKNTIYVVNLNTILHILEIKDDLICYMKSVQIHPTYGYHGLHAFESNVYLVSTTKTKEDRFVISEYNVQSGNCKHYPILGNEHRMKDISFLSETLCVILTSHNDREIGLGGEKQVYDGEIILCEFNGKEFIILDKKSFEMSHFDSVVSKNNLIYCTMVNQIGSYILTAKIEDSTITDLIKHPCEPFPHGIDIYENQIAYSCYGTSTTYIKQLPLTE